MRTAIAAHTAGPRSLANGPRRPGALPLLAAFALAYGVSAAVLARRWTAAPSPASRRGVAAAQSLPTAAPVSDASSLPRVEAAPAGGLRETDYAAGGLAMIAAALLAVAIVHDAPWLLVFAPLWLLATAATLHFDDVRSPSVALAASALSLAGGARAFGFGLAHIASVSDFAPALVALAGTMLAATLAASGLVRRLRKRDYRRQRWHAVLFAAVVAAAAMLILFSLFVTLSGRETVSADERAGAQPVRMHDIRFEPSGVTMAPGELKLIVRNDDLVVHTFTLDEAGVDTELGPGSEKIITLVLNQPGEYEYRCTVPGHGAMKAKVRVE